MIITRLNAAGVAITASKGEKRRSTAHAARMAAVATMATGCARCTQQMRACQIDFMSYYPLGLQRATVRLGGPPYAAFVVFPAKEPKHSRHSLKKAGVLALRSRVCGFYHMPFGGTKCCIIETKTLIIFMLFKIGRNSVKFYLVSNLSPIETAM